MSAKKKRRKIVVNQTMKIGLCGPNCNQRIKSRMLGQPLESFACRLRAPMLITTNPFPSVGSTLPEVGEETSFDVFATGFCHSAEFESLLFNDTKMVVVEGSHEATTSKQAFVELLSYCEDDLELETFIIAIPKRRADHRSTVRNLCHILDFKLVPASSGWNDDFIYLALELREF